MIYHKIRLANIPSNEIFNWLAPRNVTLWNNFPKWQRRWWANDIVELRNQCEEKWIEELDRLTGHFSRLEESIAKEGMKHPIKVITGLPLDHNMNQRLSINTVPPDMRTDTNKLLTTHQFGGSRLLIAQKLGIDVPCLIYDFYDSYANFPETNIDIIIKENAMYFVPYKYSNKIKTLVVKKHMHMPGDLPSIPRTGHSLAMEKVREYAAKLEEKTNNV